MPGALGPLARGPKSGPQEHLGPNPERSGELHLAGTWYFRAKIMGQRDGTEAAKGGTSGEARQS
jgi:hypothetical protein